MTDIESKLKEARISRKLDLGASRLSEELPEKLFGLESLKTLSLYRNQLKSVPKNLWTLQNITELNLYRNRLETLPNGISQLKSLQILNLGSNRFIQIPVKISKSSFLFS